MFVDWTAIYIHPVHVYIRTCIITPHVVVREMIINTYVHVHLAFVPEMKEFRSLHSSLYILRQCQ